MGPGSPRVPVVHVAAVCAIFGRVGQLSRRSVQCTTTEVFTPDFLKQPLFAPATLYDTALYYGGHNIDEEFEESFSLSDLENKNNSIKKIIWLAHKLGCDPEATIYVFDMRKQSRRLVRIHQQL